MQPRVAETCIKPTWHPSSSSSVLFDLQYSKTFVLGQQVRLVHPSIEVIPVKMDKPYPQQPSLQTDAPHRAALLTFPGNLKAALQDSLDDPKKTLIGVAHGIPSVYLTKVVFPEAFLCIHSTDIFFP